MSNLKIEDGLESDMRFFQGEMRLRVTVVLRQKFTPVGKFFLAAGQVVGQSKHCYILEVHQFILQLRFGEIEDVRGEEGHHSFWRRCFSAQVSCVCSLCLGVSHC